MDMRGSLKVALDLSFKGVPTACRHFGRRHPHLACYWALLRLSRKGIAMNRHSPLLGASPRRIHGSIGCASLVSGRTYASLRIATPGRLRPSKLGILNVVWILSAVRMKDVGESQVPRPRDRRMAVSSREQKHGIALLPQNDPVRCDSIVLGEGDHGVQGDPAVASELSSQRLSVHGDLDRQFPQRSAIDQLVESGRDRGLRGRMCRHGCQPRGRER